jgi:hypothetical protein
MHDRLESITRETLTPLARRALADENAEVTAWSAEPIHGGSGGMVGGTALYRISGETASGIPWSLVLKILRERPGESEESPYYWKREYEVYRSGMLNNLAETGLAPPPIYGFADFSNEAWIWMADLQDERPIWSFDDYHTVSRRLGRFNGAYLTGLSIPDEPWLNTSWHCRIIPPLADTFNRLDEYLQNPLIQRALPLSEKETILSIWRQAPQFCEILPQLPQTLCHIDAFRLNFFHGEAKSVLIDWAMAGRGALGEELTSMVAVSLYQPELSLSQADELDQAVFSGYMDGLRDVGWQGDERFVRLGYVCAMALRGLAGVKQDIDLLLDESTHSSLINGPQRNTIEEVADFWAGIRRFRLLQMAEEARQLLAGGR